MSGLMDRLGLGRRDLRAWAMYDWANSAVQTTIIAAIFPIYFQKVAAAGMPGPVATSRFAWATTIAILVVAVVAPVLGAVADYAPVKKRLLAMFLGIGAAATGAMFFITRGDWQLALVLFVVSNVGVAGSIVFYESLLPHIAAEEELDRVSTAGYALGYLGGGVLLAINILMMSQPAWFFLPDREVAVRASLASVAVWWVVFSIPLFRDVPEPAGRPKSGERPVGQTLVNAARRLLETLRELRRYRQAFMLLLAFLLYNDGIQTIIRMATTYGTEIGIDENAMIGALLITQFIGVPFGFLFGFFAQRIGDHDPRVLHADRDALLHARDPRGDGPGRHAGAQPIALREHDPEAQVVGVLRVLRRVRALRRDPRPGGVRVGRRAQRHEPERDPLGPRILRHRGRTADAGRRR
jgi:UMF1 family MFS transporter